MPDICVPLPKGFRRFDAFGLREHIFVRDDARGATFLSPPTAMGIYLQRWVIKRLHRGIKVIHIDVQNDPIHGFLPPFDARCEHAEAM